MIASAEGRKQPGRSYTAPASVPAPLPRAPGGRRRGGWPPAAAGGRGRLVVPCGCLFGGLDLLRVDVIDAAHVCNSHVVDH